MLFTANQIAAFAGGVVDGDPEATVSTFAKIEEGVPGAISFLANPQYEKFLYETTASVVLVNKDFVPKQPVKATLVRVDDAYEAIAKLLTIYQSMGERVVGVSEKAFVHPTAHIGADCYVAPFAYIGANVAWLFRTMWKSDTTLSSIPMSLFIKNVRWATNALSMQGLS